MRDDLLEHAMALAIRYAAACEERAAEEDNGFRQRDLDAAKAREVAAREALRAFLATVFTAGGLELDEGDLLTVDRSGKWDVATILLRGLVKASDGYPTG
jgi:hypothetical protein